MFKAASSNAVRRDSNRVVNDKSNATHADFTKQANDLSNEKAALVAEKKEHELFFSQYAKEKHHQANHYIRSKTNQSVMMKYEQERLRRLARVKEIDRRFGELKCLNHELHQSHSTMTFTDAFYRCAKDLLPHEIMQRIESATVAVLAHNNDVAEPNNGV